MNVIGIVNEAINRKLNSISFTNIIVGTVESVKPLQIRINSRILIGQSFIEPMSLGLNDYSPNSALPLVVGEKVQMVRYNNGQRFYVLGKSISFSTIKVDYETQVYNKPTIIIFDSKDTNDILIQKGQTLLDKLQNNEPYTAKLVQKGFREIGLTRYDIDYNQSRVAYWFTYKNTYSSIHDYNEQENTWRIVYSFNAKTNKLESVRQFGQYAATPLVSYNTYDGILKNYMGLSVSNTYQYTPSKDYHPATKKYVDDSITNATKSLATEEYVNNAITDGTKSLATKDYVDTNFLQFDVIEEF